MAINFDMTGIPAVEPDSPETATGPVLVNGAAHEGGGAQVDINSLDQYNDVDEIDADASVYERALPPVDGWHQIKIKLVKDGIAEKKRFQADKYQGAMQLVEFNDKDGALQRHFMLVIDSQIAEDGKQGNGQSARKWISTMPQKVNDRTTTEIDTLLGVLSGQAGVGLSRLQKADKLYQILLTEPLAWGKTQWILQATEGTTVKDRKTGEARLKQSGEAREEYVIFKYGMKSFEVDGKTQLLEEDPKTGTPARTKWQITDVKPLSAKVG